MEKQLISIFFSLLYAKRQPFARDLFYILLYGVMGNIYAFYMVIGPPSREAFLRATARAGVMHLGKKKCSHTS